MALLQYFEQIALHHNAETGRLMLSATKLVLVPDRYRLPQPRSASAEITMEYHIHRRRVWSVTKMMLV